MAVESLRCVPFQVGVVGFCMGGALAAASAVLVDDISAAVPFYGTPPAALADTTKAKAPVQGHFGEADIFKGFADVEVSAIVRSRYSSYLDT